MTKEIGAYPNYDQYMHIPGHRDLNKWIEAVKKIHQQELTGLAHTDAVRGATSGWNPMETHDFLNWLRFYQEGTHLKYKTAQLWYENGQPGYFLQIKPDPAKPAEPKVDQHSVDGARRQVEHDEEKKRLIEKQRQKIIGRLDSAEKLLRTPEGQMFAGPELENLMEAIYSLKKKVQLVNKLSTSTRLYEDMIVREANVLTRKGFTKAAGWLCATAQANNPPPPGLGTPGDINTLPPPMPPEDPSGAGHPGTPGTLPSLGPGMPQPPGNPPTAPSETQPNNPKSPAHPPTSEIAMGPPSPLPQEPPASKGMQDFLEQMDTAGKTDSDEVAVNDQLEVQDDLQVEDALMVTEAQMTPPPAVEEDIPLTTTPRKPKSQLPPQTQPKPTRPPLEMTEDDKPANEMGMKNAPAPAKDFDRVIDSALANVTVADIVAKLEDIAKIFKTREIPRQLSLVDMMLDAAGLGSLLPSLSEAQNKALESNNYISTRLDDIISRLRGVMGAHDIDLRGDDTPKRNPGAAQALQQQDEKEADRKRMRKEQETAELEGKGKETPQVEIGEDLGAPPAVPAPRAPAPPRPPAV